MNSDGTDNTTDKTSETSAVPPIISEDAAVSTDNRDIDLNENLSPDILNTSEASEEQTLSEKEKQTESSADENLKISKPAATKKQENYVLHNAIQILLGIIIGAGTGYLLLYLLIPQLFTPTEFLLILIFIIISLFINLNLYKLGQLIAGCICGGQFIAYQFTCLRFYRAEGTLHRRLTPSHSFKGECSIIPPSNRPYSVNIYIAFYTGGIAACFVVGCICIITAIFLSVNMSGNLLFTGTLLTSGKTVYFLMFLWINSIFSFLYAAFCLIPVFWNDSPSDGLILYALLKKNPYTAQLIILRAVTVQLAAGIRPSDIHIPDIIPVRIIREKIRHTTGLLTAVKKALNRLIILTGKLKSYLIRKISDFSLIKTKRNINGDSVKNQSLNDTADAEATAEISDITQSIEPEDILLLNAVKKALTRLIILTGKLKSYLIRKISDSSLIKPKRNINGDSVKNQVLNNTADAETAAEISDITPSIEPENISGDISVIIPDTVPDVVPEDISDNIPEIIADKPPSEKIRFNIGVLVYKIKLRLCPRKINKGDLQIEQFPKPAESENNLSACTLLLKLYNYYIALDNAEHADMRTNLLIIEENISRVPGQMLQRVYRELCFYYSISKNSASAAYYMEMMERSTEQKKHIDNLRVRAYFEMYINRRYKTSFSLCRNAMETAVADTSSGLTVMNKELVKGLVILIHQKSSLSKNE